MIKILNKISFKKKNTKETVKRTHTRHETLAVAKLKFITIDSNLPQEMKILNISKGGLAIEHFGAVSRNIDINASVIGNIVYGDTDIPCSIKVKYIVSSDGISTFGGEFTQINLSLLDYLIEKVATTG